MFQFHIKQYGLKGDGSGTVGTLPFQLILRVVGVTEASPKNIWIKDYDTLADAKTGAVAGVSGGALTTPALDTTSGTWTAGAAESLSVVFTLPF